MEHYIRELERDLIGMNRLRIELYEKMTVMQQRSFDIYMTHAEKMLVAIAENVDYDELIDVEGKT